MNNKELAQQACLGSTIFDLTSDNVIEVYQRNYLRWQYKVSDTVIVNGEDVSNSIERALLQLPNPEHKPNIKSLSMSNTIGGIPIKELDFIKEELISQNKLFDKYSNDIKNKRLEVKRLEIYLEYLNHRKLEISKNCHETKEGLTSRFNQIELETIFDKLVNAKWIKGNKSDFVAIFTNVTLPDNWQPIEFIKKWGKNPHTSAIATLVKYISPETGNKIIWDGYFTFNKKPLKIPANNRGSVSIVNDLDLLFK